MLVIKGRKREAVERIRGARGETDVFLKSKTGVPLLLEILNSTRVERIHCSEAIFRRIPQGAREAVEKVGVEFVIEETRKGRPRAHPEFLVERITSARRAGRSARTIAYEMRVPLRTVYYHLRAESRGIRKANKTPRAK
ncbi:MAG: hypothetical protein AB1468_01605 [Candidatus Micrarchaeota archaeon]